jgi:uncharacterized protein (DUF1501 family)
MDRRKLLKGCAEFILSQKSKIGLEYFFEENDEREIVVVVFLRGGMDGLNLLAPVNDPLYRVARAGKLGIKEDGADKGLFIDSNNAAKYDFRLHPGSGGLKELYDNKSLAFIHASGLVNGTRSHFEAQDLMELGTNDDKNLAQGWLSRYIKTFHSGVYVPAFAIGNTAPASLLGNMDSLNLTEIRDLKLDWNPKIKNILSEMYADGDSLVHISGKGALDNIEHIKSAVKESSGFEHYTPEHNADYAKDYPGEELARSFKTVAQLIKMDIGLKVATVDFDGWDMHDGQQWRFKEMIDALSRNMVAFYNDIYKYHDKVTVVVMSEFGRRLKENKNGGTDHGHGGVMMVLGNNVKGGKMYGKWPGLENENLDKGVDLAITTDYRSVLAEVLLNRKLVKDHKDIFPKFDKYSPHGIIKKA